MAVYPVLKMGAKSLLERSLEVKDFNTDELEELLQNMWDTMAAEDGAGLAAPQIGINLRVVVFGYQQNPRYPDAPAVPETVLINPVITPIDEEIELGWEGCLSVPGMRGLVPRYRQIRYLGCDQYGNAIDRSVSGFHARVVQHECDHLDGILYPQKITDMRNFGFCEELEKSGLMEPQPCDDE